VRRVAAGFVAGLVVGTSPYLLAGSDGVPTVELVDVPAVAIEPVDDDVEVPPWEDDLFRVPVDLDDEDAMAVEAQCAIDILNAVGLDITAASVVVLGYWSDMAYGGSCEHKEAVWPTPTG